MVEVDKTFNHAVRIAALSVTRNRCFSQLVRCASVGVAGGAYVVEGFCGGLLTFCTVLYDKTDGFLDPDPVELLGDRSGGFVDTAVLLCVHVPGDFVLSLRITHYLFVF